MEPCDPLALRGCLPLYSRSRFGLSWHGVPRLLIEFSHSEEQIDVETAGRTVRVTIDGVSHELPRAVAATLRDDIAESLTERRAFFRTAGVHREDGSYVVERRNADSTGNSSVFESFDELRRFFDRLPSVIDADSLSRAGITGSRRHMLVRHFVEHPAFDCELDSRNPLRARKTGDERTGGPRTAANAD